MVLQTVQDKFPCSICHITYLTSQVSCETQVSTVLSMGTLRLGGEKVVQGHVTSK